MNYVQLLDIWIPKYFESMRDMDESNRQSTMMKDLTLPVEIHAVIGRYIVQYLRFLDICNSSLTIRDKMAQIGLQLEMYQRSHTYQMLQLIDDVIEVKEDCNEEVWCEKVNEYCYSLPKSNS